uniref:Si:dkey-122a22.2 n=1 Tax=Erpetoichthys calabaricus TaxID=27687 RepID=A0A8C4T4N3_ERPCA
MQRRKPKEDKAGDRAGNKAGDWHRRAQQKPDSSDAAADTQKSWYSHVLSVGKFVLLLIFIPPFLNYASLQREGLLLQPEVLLDAPTGMSSDVWFQIQEDLSHLTKVCAYDRVGLGFSKRAPQNETTGMEKIWRESTTGRMVDDLHRLTKEASLQKPFIIVGSELGALNVRFYSHIHDWEVSDLVLIDPIPEDIFKEEMWQDYWYKDVVPRLQAMQFSAATGLSRLLLIAGWMQQPLVGLNVSEDLIRRQKYLLSNPAHQSGAVDEHFFLNESAFQVREISKYKPLSSATSVTVITGDKYDELLPTQINEMVARLQEHRLVQIYPQAQFFKIAGVDRRMIYRNPLDVTKHLVRLIKLKMKPVRQLNS